MLGAGAPRPRLLPAAARAGDLRPGRAGAAARNCAPPASAPPRRLIDRYQLPCRPIRDLLVDYLRERQPALDYASLDSSPAELGMFWADLEAHHPGIDSLHLSAEVAGAWKQRMRTKPKTVTTADGSKTVTEHRADLPPRVPDSGPGLLPRSGPVGRRGSRPVGTLGSALPRRPAETIQGKVQRHRKSRMDARTRERLPVLPVLVRCAAQQHADAAALLHAARSARPGDSHHRRRADPGPRHHQQRLRQYLGRRPGHRRNGAT